MPKATIENIEPQKYNLKTAPDEADPGFVMLRRMSYGQWLNRQELALNLKIETSKGKDTQGEMAMANRKVTEFEFQNSVTDHNLENADGEKLDFRKATTLDLLDPRIGNEIATYIMELHEFVADEDSAKN